MIMVYIYILFMASKVVIHKVTEIVTKFVSYKSFLFVCPVCVFCLYGFIKTRNNKITIAININIDDGL